MLKKIFELQPEKVWKHFYDLTQIPRPSGHEDAVIKHIKKFAIQRNLEYHIDEVGNILVRKSGHPLRSGAKTIILQSHVDMVPQKNNDKVHDFTLDPIQTIIDGEWVRADKTTLGADNGIGVASILSILDSEDIKCGPVEGLFTISEETGMDGAFGLKAGFLVGGILLNLDSEDERELIIGCAGGVNADMTWDYNLEKVPEGKTFTVEVKGLKGGHSGIDINLGRANANKLLVKLLLILGDKCKVRLSSFKGGNLRNAIPREAEANVVVPVEYIDKLHQTIEEYYNFLIKEYQGIETDLAISANEIGKTIGVMSVADQQNALKALDSCPNGVIKMSPVLTDIVQTSTNLAIVRVGEGKCTAQCMLRSSLDKDKDELTAKIKQSFEPAKAEIILEGDYPGWNPDNDSMVLAKAKETYKKIFKMIPEVKVIHAGLECGIIGGVYPKLDMISFGPTIRHPHSPDEKVNIASVEKFWIFLKSLLEEI
jgi:dipeptidase D